MTRWSISILFLMSACGGPPPRTAASSGVPSPPQPWAQMDHHARAAWMGSEVLPRMTVVFQEWDPQRYANFSCANCHGERPQERNFRMPNPGLPALHPTGSPEQHQMLAEYERACTVMFSRVRPTMQALLGAEEFNRDAGTGFSCYACHPHAGDEGATPIRLGAQP